MCGLVTPRAGANSRCSSPLIEREHILHQNSLLHWKRTHSTTLKENTFYIEREHILHQNSLLQWNPLYVKAHTTRIGREHILRENTFYIGAPFTVEHILHENTFYIREHLLHENTFYNRTSAAGTKFASIKEQNLQVLRNNINDRRPCGQTRCVGQRKSSYQGTKLVLRNSINLP